MARKTSDLTAVDAKRVSHIAESIFKACSGMLGELGERQEAEKALDGAREKVVSKRETIMCAVAKVAESEGWTMQEVDSAAAAAAKMHNGEKSSAKAMETFCGEIRYAAHPLVRDHIDALLSVRDDAWSIETEQLEVNPAYPAPLRKCFKRKYHAFIGAMKAARDGTLFKTVDAIVAYAVANNPDHDPKNVHKRLMALQKELAAWAVDYPADDLAHAADTLGRVTLKDIEAARAERMGVTHPQPAAQPAKPVPVPVPAPATTVPQASAVLARAFTPTVVNVSTPTLPTPTPIQPTQIEQDIENLLGDNQDYNTLSVVAA